MFAISDNLTRTVPDVHRDHDELRYSLRSVVQYFRPHLNRMHILAGDFASPDGCKASFPSAPSPSSPHKDSSSPDRDVVAQNVTSPEPHLVQVPHRLGQIPQWLRDDVDTTKWRADGKASVTFHHHAQFFENYAAPTFNRFVARLFAGTEMVD